MLTILFLVLMVGIFGKMIAFAFRAAWGLAKCALFLVFLPVIILVIFAMGFVYVALPILVIVGIVMLISNVLS